jgi:hypothetical protein
MATDRVQALADDNFAGSWRVMTEAADGGVVDATGPVLLLATGAPVAFLNGAFVTQPVGDPGAAVDAIVEFYRQQQVPFLVRIREGLDPAFEDAAIAAGLQRAPDLPGMVLDPIPPPTPRRDDVDIREAVDQAGLDDCVAVLSEAFGMPTEIGRRVITMRSVGGLFRAGVAYEAGRPVATAAVCTAGDVAGVYNVATVAASRGRGLGEAVTWWALDAGAAVGAQLGSLQASAMGYPIYERMGFRPTAVYHQLVGPGPGDC